MHKIMKIPSRKRHWVKEIEKAIDAGHSQAFKDSADPDYFYRYAPPIMMKNRGIKSESVSEEIYEFIESLVDQDWSIDPNSRKQYVFHFVSSYLYAHVPAGYLEEMEADRIMDYINDNMDLLINT